MTTGGRVTTTEADRALDPHPGLESWGAGPGPSEIPRAYIALGFAGYPPRNGPQNALFGPGYAPDVRDTQCPAAPDAGTGG